MIGHQSPRLHGKSTRIRQGCHRYPKIVPIVIVAKELASLDARCHNMLQGTGRIRKRASSITQLDFTGLLKLQRPPYHDVFLWFRLAEKAGLGPSNA